ncbi:hypothetical protein [Oerskovia rustica]|uniref:Uncharacterized protein n=1 Tax=Oerskovia rustica TaxID=2762237 RepID=A0ABR8RNN3_9CELL|nr:hypothetical protein [Oerskovia rustica]MBD7949371.1 hypothetical protein [Oerskovia rustica]
MKDIDMTGGATTTARPGTQGLQPDRPSEVTGAPPAPHDGRRPTAPRWPRRVPPMTIAWWTAGALTALVAVLTGRNLPVGAGTPDAAGTIVDSVPSSSLTAVLATLGLVGAAHATWMTTRADHPATRRVRAAAVAVSGLVASAGVVFADTSLLARMGYLPVVLVRAPFDPALAGAVDQYVAPAFLLQLGVLVALVLLAVTTVLFVRRSSGACEVCGRLDPPADHHAPAPAGQVSARPSGIVAWGRPAAIVAAIIPCVYAATRLIWVLGYPLGLDPEMYEQDAGKLVAPAVGLSLFALVGAVLTLGLVQRWGEVFPRWIPGLAGRRVPVALAVVPASVVTVAILPAGLSMIKGLLEMSPSEVLGNWAAFGPGVLWPLWSVALGVATAAYATRRRGTCPTCGRTS